MNNSNGRSNRLIITLNNQSQVHINTYSSIYSVTLYYLMLYLKEIKGSLL